MRAEHLNDLWSSPDNSRLTTKQLSFRLPVHIAAKIAALCEMYPQRNRTQIVADLLTSALDELEKTLPEALGEPVGLGNDEIARQIGQEGQTLYYMGGLRARFMELANKHYCELEGELGNEKPEPLFATTVLSESDLKK